MLSISTVDGAARNFNLAAPASLTVQKLVGTECMYIGSIIDVQYLRLDHQNNHPSRASAIDLGSYSLQICSFGLPAQGGKCL